MLVLPEDLVINDKADLEIGYRHKILKFYFRGVE